jgi:diguanylate cyclase (GGDEF)-like protein/PAS domain S-box-containing protein
MPASTLPHFLLPPRQPDYEAAVNPWIAQCEIAPIHRPDTVQNWGALLIVDQDGLTVRHASANLAAFIEHRAEDVLGRPMRAWADGETLAALGEAIGDVGPTGTFKAFASSGLGPRPVMVSGYLADGRIFVEFEPDEAADRHRSGANAWAHTRAAIEVLENATGSGALFDAAARELRRATGFDRAMVYRFDRVGHGEVIAEDLAPDLEPFLGLRYPASDIPRQARRLYLRQSVRVIADVDAAPVALLNAAGESESADLSLAALRAAAPVHLEYLRHMGVRATIAVSLKVDGGLWGMLVCHHRTPQAVPLATRVLCGLIGQVIPLMAGTLAVSEARLATALRARRISTLAGRLEAAPGGAAGLAAALAANGTELLALCDAGGAVIRLGDRSVSIGNAPGGAAGATLLAAVLAMTPEGGQPLVCGELGRLLPADQCHGVAGVLTLALDHRPGEGIVWLRPEQARIVRWGGDPRAAVGEGMAGPRQSFAVWQEQVRGQCLPWTEPHIEAARALRRELDQLLARHAEAELVHLRHRDPLTGLPNRRLLLERLQSWSQELPTPCLLVVEIDRFRALNDTVGAVAGDALLIEAGARIGAVAARPGVLVARIGGDEFAVFSHRLSAEAAESLGERLLVSLALPYEVAGQVIRVTASIGIALATGAVPRLEADDLLAQADLALQAAKQAGGNRVSRFRRALASGAGRRMDIEQQLRAAVEGDAGNAGSFHLVYQPCVALGLAVDGAADPAEMGTPAVAAGPPLRGFEALLRWHHPRLGSVAPGEFIGIAEACDLIVPLGHWVLHEAIRQIKAWEPVAIGLPAATWRVAVNVSPRQLIQPGFVGGVLALLAEHAVPCSQLTIEVTEGVFADGAATAAVAELRAAGLRIAVDDFGCGYSSLSYLRRLPADELKLDRSFLQRAEDGRLQENLLTALVQLARAVGLSVLAEGVETELDLAAVWAAGCDAAQGYLFAEPMPVEAAGEWIRSATREVHPGPRGQHLPFSFRDVVEVATDAVVVTSAELEQPGPRITYANPAFTRMTGWSLTELLGRSPRMLQGPATSHAALRHIGEALRAGRAVHETLVNYSRSGEAYWCELSISPLRNQEGRITHFVAIERPVLPDVTEAG